MLGLLADDRTEEEVAVTLGKSPAAVKSAVQRLKIIFECKSVRDLRRMWRNVRADYVAYVADVSGM